MSMTVDQIVSEARQLPQDLRAELLDRLGGALHGDASPEVAAEWNQLALDRLAAVESGRSQLRPGEEVLARMRQLIGRSNRGFLKKVPRRILPRPSRITARKATPSPAGSTMKSTG
jgi:hypothetical protein